MGFMKSAINNLLGISNKKNEGGSGEGMSLEEFLNEIPAKLGFDVQITKVESDQPGQFFNIEGNEAQEFLGQNTEVLDALSHLSMRVLRRHEGVSNAPTTEKNENFRVVFDASGFRDKKIQELKDLASEFKKKVLESGGRPSYIKALSPGDRKIIHTAIAELGDVTSESIGKGNFKRIRIKIRDDSPLKKTLKPIENLAEGADASGGAPLEGNDGNSNMGNRRHAGGQARGRGPQHGGGQGGGRGGPRRGPGGGPNRGRGGGGGGPNRSGQSGHFRGRGGQGPNRGPGADAPENYGNRIEDTYTEPAHVPDDNIGNRLRPGETPIYPGFKSGGSSSNDGSNRGSDL